MAESGWLDQRETLEIEIHQTMRLGIVGCGITGTAIACLLSEAGHRIEIFEQASACKPMGAGIMLQPSGQQVLRRMGLLEDVMRVAERLDGMSAVLKSGRELVRLKYSSLEPALFGLGVHRGELYELLLRKCREVGVTIHAGQPIVSAGSSADGHWVESKQAERFGGFDFLIGADGSASALRKQSGIRTRVHEYEHAAMWATGHCEFQPRELLQVVDGTEKLVGLLPIGGNRSSFFWGIRASEYETLRNSSIDKWKASVLEICPAAESVLTGLNTFDDLTFAKYRDVSMKTWFDGRVLFLGDAAHATSPHLGQGVNLALEDAMCFADELGRLGDFAAACDSYTRIRKSKLRYYSRLTRFLTPFFQSSGWGRGKLRDVFLPWFPRTPFVRREMLRTLCGFKNGWLK
jgi:2-polyprenyl-6-methoxyphenol hydroxylase-like FAD-dependent oxidoreductase